MEKIIELVGVSYLYGRGTPFEKRALNNISVGFSRGRITGLIGHTGSGKSTLISLLNGLNKPTEGTVYLEGVDIWENPKEIAKIRARVGLVMQYPEYQLFDETVRLDIGFAPRNFGLSDAEIEERVKSAAKFVGISDDMLDKSPFELSGGEKRRAAIAGVMAMRPEVLILDEPTAGLDPHGRDLILEQIDRYRRENGTTVLLVSHSMEDVARIADKVLVMQDSRVAMYDTAPRVFDRAAELEEMGLSVPAVTRIFSQLADKGIADHGAVYTLEQAEQTAVALLKEKGVTVC